MDLSEFWGLEAVVRGSTSTAEAASFSNLMNNPSISSSPSLFSPISFDDDDDDRYLGFSAFSGIFGSKTEELDVFEAAGIYNHNKPLNPLLHQSVSSPQSILTTISTPPREKTDHQQPQKVVQERLNLSSESADNSATAVTHEAIPHVAKPRKRKNQQKRVVQQVSEDGLSSDKWAWRKYGQKPIKGSPYPRSYYRCSSLKGCLARKQVERSSSDPSVFIVTYTADHSHPHPIRRNSLAGTTRIKPSMPKYRTINVDPNRPAIKEEFFPNLDAVLSPTAPSMASIEDHGFVQNARTMIIKEEKAQASEAEKHGEIVMRDIIFSDELFPSLEDFDGFLLGSFEDSYVHQ